MKPFCMTWGYFVLLFCFETGSCCVAQTDFKLMMLIASACSVPPASLMVLGLQVRSALPDPRGLMCYFGVWNSLTPGARVQNITGKQGNQWGSELIRKYETHEEISLQTRKRGLVSPSPVTLLSGPSHPTTVEMLLTRHWPCSSGPLLASLLSFGNPTTLVSFLLW